MKPILTAQQMRDMERAYFDAGAASIDLMERAAAALCDELLHALAGRGKTCVFACGTGGNGGDGYAAARLFAEKGGRATFSYLLDAEDARLISRNTLEMTVQHVN